MLQIINNKTNTSILLDSRECIHLELSLNVTRHGNEWKHIGDALYEYGTERVGENSTLTVTEEQFGFLLLLREKGSWRECSNLSLYP